MKKIIVLAFLPVLFVSVVAHAQVSAGGPGMTTVFMPVTSGFVQFDSLTVQGLVPATTPGTVGAIVATASVTNPCYQFQSETDAVGTAVMCPMPAAQNGSSTNSITYTIEISSTTELMLSDRSPATLSDFAAGDEINVFGYYNADGSIEAYLVRDLSKPVLTAVPQTIQLDNVILNSVSGTNVPATLAVTQAIGFPCYSFSDAGEESTITCPMGIASFSGNTATANVTPLPSLMPAWQDLHKYVINVDAQTIILDKNRTQVSLASLNVGDALNVYGVTTDNGQTVTANIIRDLSIPASASAYTGTVTQVNADGSFVIQTNNGQTLTVQNPVTIGTTVTIQGLLNSSESTISQVSNISIGGISVMHPAPATN